MLERIDPAPLSVFSASRPIREAATEPPQRIWLSSWGAGLIGADIVGVLIVHWIMSGIGGSGWGSSIIRTWPGLISLFLLWVLSAQSFGAYSSLTLLDGRRALLTSGAIVFLIAFGFLVLVTLGSGYDGIAAYSLILPHALGVLVWCVVVRLVFDWRLRLALTKGSCVERVLVLAGSIDDANQVERDLQAATRRRASVVAKGLLPELAGGSSMTALEDAIRNDLVDRVYISGFDNWVPEAHEVISSLTQLAVDVTLLPNIRGLCAASVRAGNGGGILGIDVSRRPLSVVQAIAKRAEDLVLAGIVLALTAPVLIMITIAIKFDSPGPVFFRQVRLGYHDRAFTVWKFRTMYHHERVDGELRQTRRNDSRVTRFGRFLRRTSLDELPQIFNVLKGDMSIVGPRPHAQTMTTEGRPLHRVVETYAARHRIKPGITGWAQVKGCRGEVTNAAQLRQRVSYDCYYIENWSVLFDLWIILCTIKLIFSDPEAY